MKIISIKYLKIPLCIVVLIMVLAVDCQQDIPMPPVESTLEEGYFNTTNVHVTNFHGGITYADYFLPRKAFYIEAYSDSLLFDTTYYSAQASSGSALNYGMKISSNNFTEINIYPADDSLRYLYRTGGLGGYQDVEYSAFRKAVQQPDSSGPAKMPTGTYTFAHDSSFTTLTSNTIGLLPDQTLTLIQNGGMVQVLNYDFQHYAQDDDMSFLLADTDSLYLGFIQYFKKKDSLYVELNYGWDDQTSPHRLTYRYRSK